MKPVVYIDILFFVNLLINSLTLHLTSILLKHRISARRILFFASVLALYSSIMFFPRLGLFYSLVGKAAVLAISVTSAFPARSVCSALKSIAVFFAVNAIFGGVMLALIFCTDFGTRTEAVISNGEIYFNLKLSTVLLSVVPAYLTAYIVSAIRKQGIKKSHCIAEMTVVFRQRKIKISAFADTGCDLCEPFSGKPAVIISRLAARKLLPHGFFKALTKDTNNSDLGQYASAYRALPFFSINNKKGILNGFVPDGLFINNTEIPHCTVAVAFGSLCEDGAYEALFNPCILDFEKNPQAINFSQKGSDFYV